MDALRQAQLALIEAESMFATSEEKDENAFYRGLSEKHFQEAISYAAVAQAEQLKRIADAMQWRNNLLHREFELFESTIGSDE